jgi:hypothetical protein
LRTCRHLGFRTYLTSVGGDWDACSAVATNFLLGALRRSSAARAQSEADVQRSAHAVTVAAPSSPSTVPPAGIGPATPGLGNRWHPNLIARESRDQVPGSSRGPRTRERIRVSGARSPGRRVREACPRHPPRGSLGRLLESRGRGLGLPQHPDEQRAKSRVLLGVDEELGCRGKMPLPCRSPIAQPTRRRSVGGCDGPGVHAHRRRGCMRRDP